MAIAVDISPEITKAKETKVSVIDCDIHHYDAYGNAPVERGVYPYLSKRWQRHHDMIGGKGRSAGSYPRGQVNAARVDSWPPSGRPPGSDLEFMQMQLLDEFDMDYGILNPIAGGGVHLNLDYSAALATAINDWQIAEWLEPEPRLKASIDVPYEDGPLAAAEIRRVGGHDGFVQVMLLARTGEPLGRRKYWPIYEAAVEMDLPIGIHFGGIGGGPITGAGWPSYYIEDHGGMPQAFQAQIISLVCEGIFERFPTLRVAIIEGGFAWLPSLAWRLDQSWRRLKEEVPHLKRAPSEYIADHFWLTTQPVEEPRQPKHFKQLLDQMNGSERLMFATDYPHWDFDSPVRTLPANLPLEVRQNIMAENARAFYSLE
ncbi:MAG: amidohydrolase family protein [Chloroflexota bacterium]